MPAPLVGEPVAGAFDDLAYVLDAGGHRRQRHELTIGPGGHDLRQSGLARSGGPQRMTDDRRSASMRARSGAPAPSRWGWPTISSSRPGRIRAARGACLASCSSTAGSNRLSECPASGILRAGTRGRLPAPGSSVRRSDADAHRAGRPGGSPLHVAASDGPGSRRLWRPSARVRSTVEAEHGGQSPTSVGDAPAGALHLTRRHVAEQIEGDAHLRSSHSSSTGA